MIRAVDFLDNVKSDWKDNFFRSLFVLMIWSHACSSNFRRAKARN